MPQHGNHLPARHIPLEERARIPNYQALALNVGIAVFILEGLWQCLRGPFETSSGHRFHSALFNCGLALAGVAWSMTLRGASWLKTTMAAAVITGILIGTLVSVRQFDADERILSAGSLRDGRVEYPELGLSFAAPTEWQMNLQPFVRERATKKTSQPNRTRVRHGETAVFFQSAPASGMSSTGPIADSIQIEGGPFNFRSLGRTLTTIRGLEASYRSLANVQITHPTRCREIGNLDVADFQLVDTSQQIRYRHVFVRSGDVRLDFVLTSPADAVPERFEPLIRSIRITRQPTRFDF